MINNDISVLVIALPSSALTFNALSSVITNSLPSPSIWLYTPSSNALSNVDLPWYPPPTIRVIPFGIPIPLIILLFGVLNSTSNSLGEINFFPSFKGFCETPLSLGNIELLPTKATRFLFSSSFLINSWSSTNFILSLKALVFILL